MKKKIKNMLLITALLGLGIFLVQGISVAEAKDPDFPTKPITFYVHRAAGAMSDLVARELLEVVTKNLGQPFVVINQPAGAGAIAALTVMNAKPDGYTLGFATGSLLYTIPHNEVSPYRDLSGFTLIMNFGKIIYPILVRTDAPFKNWKEFIEWARKNPRAAKLGTPGGGRSQSAAAMTMWEAEQKEEVSFTYVPFKGGAESLFALLGGHITLDFNVITPTVRKYIEEGKLRVLAYLSETKAPGVVEIPSLHELYGIKLPDKMVIWGPKGLPKYTLEKLEGAFIKGAREPNFANAMKKYEVVVSTMNSADCTKEANAEFLRVGENMKRIQAEEAEKKE